MIQIRNVPDALHRGLKARAALSGMSLYEFLCQEIRRMMERPTREEILRRIAQRAPESPAIEPAEMVRKERDSR